MKSHSQIMHGAEEKCKGTIKSQDSCYNCKGRGKCEEFGDVRKIQKELVRESRNWKEDTINIKED